MDDRRKTVAAITLIIIFVSLLVLVGLVLVTRKKSLVSPVPEEGAIRIIFVSPTATSPAKQDLASPETPTLKPKATATPKPTSGTTATPTPTKISSPSATPKS
ncbi:MAG: hypothetical protein AAB800_03935 [Patescibacteria group bacterium]